MAEYHSTDVPPAEDYEPSTEALLRIQPKGARQAIMKKILLVVAGLVVVLGTMTMCSPSSPTLDNRGGRNVSSQDLISQSARGGSDCRTTDGWPCAFPFKYEGTTFYACTKVDQDPPSPHGWCYKTVDQYGGGSIGNWGNCDASCDTEKCSTLRGVPCVFPFNYETKTYHSCTWDGTGNKYAWCYTEVDTNSAGVKGKWGKCGASCFGLSEDVPEGVDCEVEDSLETPIGEMPQDEGDRRKKECEDDSGMFTKFQIYTDPQNYYTAGFKCCRKVEDPKVPFKPEDCTFEDSCDTPIGQMPVDTGKKLEQKCAGTFIPYETYAEPSHYYCAGFKCCKSNPRG